MVLFEGGSASSIVRVSSFSTMPWMRSDHCSGSMTGGERTVSMR